MSKGGYACTEMVIACGLHAHGKVERNKLKAGALVKGSVDEGY